MPRATIICLWPNIDNRHNPTQLLVFLGCASGNNYTSWIIPLFIWLPKFYKSETFPVWNSADFQKENIE